LSRTCGLGLSPAPRATSAEAPLRSRTVGFPQPGSDLGCPRQAFPTGEVSVLTPIRPDHRWFASHARFGDPVAPGHPVHRTRNRPVPRAPLPDSRCYRLVRVASHTTGKGLTPSSSLLRAQASDQTPPIAFAKADTRVFAGWGQSLLEDGRSRPDRCDPDGGACTLTPPCPSGASARFVPEDDGRPSPDRTSRTRDLPAMQLPQGVPFEAAVLRSCSGSPVRSARWLHPSSCRNPGWPGR
jgi:hypothetical protein